MFAATRVDARPACAGHLDIVDHAFDRPGDSGELRALCAECPVSADCLTFAMTHAEWGIWGGTSAKVRTQRGAPSTRPWRS